MREANFPSQGIGTSSCVTRRVVAPGSKVGAPEREPHGTALGLQRTKCNLLVRSSCGTSSHIMAPRDPALDLPLRKLSAESDRSESTAVCHCHKSIENSKLPYMELDAILVDVVGFV